MFYIPVDIEEGLINVSRQIVVQKGLTNNFPEIVFELHKHCGEYIDLGDSCELWASVTNTDQESVVFTGELLVMNPHRGQILCRLVEKDFTMTGINTLTVFCKTDNFSVSFQTTIFIQSILKGIQDILKQGDV